MFAMTKAMRSKGAVRLLLIASAMTCCATPAFAQEAAQPSESAMVNLVRQLVKQGVLTRDAGEALMRQAEAEATQAKAANAAAPAAQAAANTLPGAPAGTIRVPYVPETVRQQIRDEIRGDVMREAKAEGWASPGDAAPDWTKRISIHGDIRVRSQSELYSKMNDNLILDLARLNASPFDQALLGVNTLPFLNSREDRWNRLKLRARLGLDAEVTKGVKAAFALATGDDGSPISTNANLGGGLGKRDVWLDLGYVRITPVEWLSFNAGRFPNPFHSTQLLYDEDLRFDGVSAEIDAAKLLGGEFDLALKGGAFPLDFGSPDFPVVNPDKRKVPSKYLFAAEISGGVDAFHDVRVDASVGYHSFNNIQGKLSEPCNVADVLECTSDYLKPSFLRKGNTLSFLRTVQIDANNPNAPQPNLLGYKFDYDVLDVNASIRVPLDDKIGVKVAGNYIRNLSFKRSEICRFGTLGQPFNNAGSGNGDICDPANPTPFVGGGTGYLASVMLGHDRPKKVGEWSVTAEYRYLESDAVLDSLTDSDFHLGGTNAKGYVLTGRYGLRDGLVVGARWYSANEVSGTPFAIDVLQIDLSAAF